MSLHYLRPWRDPLLLGWIEWQRRSPKRENAPVLALLLYHIGGAPR